MGIFLDLFQWTDIFCFLCCYSQFVNKAGKFRKALKLAADHCIMLFLWLHKDSQKSWFYLSIVFKYHCIINLEPHFVCTLVCRLFAMYYLWCCVITKLFMASLMQPLCSEVIMDFSTRWRYCILPGPADITYLHYYLGQKQIFLCTLWRYWFVCDMEAENKSDIDAPKPN